MKKYIVGLLSICFCCLAFLSGCGEKSFDDIDYQSSDITIAQLIASYNQASSLNSNLNAMHISQESIVNYLGLAEDGSVAVINNSVNTDYKYKTDSLRMTLLSSTTINDSTIKTLYRNNKYASYTGDAPSVGSITPDTSTTESRVQQVSAMLNLDMQGLNATSIMTKTFKNTTYYKAVFDLSSVNSNIALKQQLVSDHAGQQVEYEELKTLIEKSYDIIGSSSTQSVITPPAQKVKYVYFGDGMCKVSLLGSDHSSFPYTADYYAVCSTVAMQELIGAICEQNNKNIGSDNLQIGIVTKNKVNESNSLLKGKKLSNFTITTSGISDPADIVSNEYLAYYRSTSSDAVNWYNAFYQNNETFVSSYVFEFGINANGYIVMTRTQYLLQRLTGNTEDAQRENYYSSKVTNILNNYAGDFTILSDATIYDNF